MNIQEYTNFNNEYLIEHLVFEIIYSFLKVLFIISISKYGMLYFLECNFFTNFEYQFVR